MGVLDAWVYGIPCVVTTVGGLPNVIEKERTASLSHLMMWMRLPCSFEN